MHENFSEINFVISVIKKFNMQTKVIVFGAAVALLAAFIIPSEGYVPAVSVILPVEYALLKLKAAAIAGLLYLTGGNAGLHFDVGAGPGTRFASKCKASVL